MLIGQELVRTDARAAADAGELHARSAKAGRADVLLRLVAGHLGSEDDLAAIFAYNVMGDIMLEQREAHAN